jgi:hypothetical protein
MMYATVPPIQQSSAKPATMLSVVQRRFSVARFFSASSKLVCSARAGSTLGRRSRPTMFSAEQ